MRRRAAVFSCRFIAGVEGSLITMKTRILLLPVCVVVILQSAFVHSARAQATSVKRITRGLPGSPPPSSPGAAAKPAAGPASAIVPAQTTTNATNLFLNAVPGKSEKEKEESLRKTIEYQKQRAEEGSATSQYDLGMRYLKGDGLEKDLKLARTWLSKSAEGGNNQAKEKLLELDIQ